MQEALRKLIFQAKLFTRREEKKYDMSEVEIMILELLDRKREMSVSEVHSFFPSKSLSTISTVLTDFWKEKLVKKKIDPENQRVVIVRLLAKGRKELGKIRDAKMSQYSQILNSLELSAREKEILRKVLSGGIGYLDSQLLEVRK